MGEEIKTLKTSWEWKQYLQNLCWITDPDGWDRKNWEFSFFQEMITEEEFHRRLALSTVHHPPKVCLCHERNRV